jgi:cytochrome c oxidase cbb3-type subunit 4
MTIDTIFNDASRLMTVLGFMTFMGILAWTFVLNREADFHKAAALPFADDDGAADPVEEDYV